MNSKKRVLHISHTDIRTDSRILKELEALHDTNKYVVKGIGVDYGNQDAKYVRNKFEVGSINVSFAKKKWKPSIVRHLLAYIELFLKVVLSVRKFKPDIIHCHDTLAFFIGSCIGLVCKVKLVYDAHELESQKNGQTNLDRKITYFVERLFWRRVDLFITVSPSIITWYHEKFGNKRNSCLVMNSPIVDKQEFVIGAKDASKPYFRDKFNIDEDSIIFIYLGLLSTGRGIENIIDAFKNVDNKAHVVFMGYGPLENSIQELSERYKNIHLHEAVPHSEVVKVTKNADVGLCFVENVSLSDYYALPNKLFEYAFSGVPVLASDFPDLAKVVSQYGLGYCATPNAKSIQEQVTNIINQPLPVLDKDLSDLSWAAQASNLTASYELLAR